MKSKNMILLGIAMVCGLGAAFLTSRLSGGSSGDNVQVPVAKKEIPMGTELKDENLEEFIEFSQLPKTTLPQDIITDVEQLKKKQVNRLMRKGNTFTPGDLGVAEMPVPKGMYKMALRVDEIAAAGGFLWPGDRVDVIFTENLPNGKVKSGMIHRGMLVLTVDISGRRDDGAAGVSGRAAVKMVTLAVTQTQSLELSAAEKRGAIKLSKRNSDDEDLTFIEPVMSLPGFDPKEKKESPVVVEQKGTYVVAKINLPMNTEITPENLQQYFEVKEVAVAAIPEKALKETGTLPGKFMAQSRRQGDSIHDEDISTKKIEMTPMVVVGPMMQDPMSEPKVEVKKPPVQKKHIMTVGSTHYLYVEVGPDDFRLVGPVTDLQSIRNEIEPTPATTPAKKEEKKSKPMNPQDKPV